MALNEVMKEMHIDRNRSSNDDDLDLLELMDQC